MITCEFENGNKASLRHVVVDILIIEKGKILLVKRAPHLLNGGKFALVGGYVDRDETTIEAAIREAEEETGYRITINKLLRIKDNPNRKGEDRQNISFVYLATVIDKISEPDDESTDVRWFDLHELPSEEEFAFDHYEDVMGYLEQ